MNGSGTRLQPCRTGVMLKSSPAKGSIPNHLVGYQTSPVGAVQSTSRDLSFNSTATKRGYEGYINALVEHTNKLH